MDSVIAFAPATVANVGPCYDIMGYALHHVGDFVVAEKTGDPAGGVEWGGVQGPRSGLVADVPPERNAAFVVARDVWKKLTAIKARSHGVRITLHKYMEAGTGLGSSSCSGVAAARAVLSLAGEEPGRDEIIGSLLLGEEAACGSGHPDNVVPSFFGGFQFMTVLPYDGFPGGEERSYRVPGGRSLISVVVKPTVSVGTREARGAVLESIHHRFCGLSPGNASSLLKLVREQSVKAADMVMAWMNDDVRRIGAIMRNNDLLETPRGPLIPRFNEVKRAALDAGAYGCSIAGSGPSVVAVTDNRETAREVRSAMQAAFSDISTRWLVSAVNRQGAVLVDSIDDFTAAAALHTDMMGV